MDAYTRLFPTLFAEDDRLSKDKKIDILKSMAFDAYCDLSRYGEQVLQSKSKDTVMNLAAAVDAIRYAARESFYELLTANVGEKLNLDEKALKENKVRCRCAQTSIDAIDVRDEQTTIKLPSGDSFRIIVDADKETLRPVPDTYGDKIAVNINNDQYEVSRLDAVCDGWRTARDTYFDTFRALLDFDADIQMQDEAYKKSLDEAKSAARDFRAEATEENLGRLLGKMSRIDDEARKNYLFDRVDDDMRGLVESAFAGTHWDFDFEPMEEGTVFTVWHDDDNPYTEPRCSVFATAPGLADAACATVSHARKLIAEDFEAVDKRKQILADIKESNPYTDEDYEADDIPWC